MISSKRIHRAKMEAKQAVIATNAEPNLTRNPYYRDSAQGKAFSKGYSQTRNKFKFLWRL